VSAPLFASIEGHIRAAQPGGRLPRPNSAVRSGRIRLERLPSHLLQERLRGAA